MGIIWPVAGEMSAFSRALAGSAECSCDICPRNDQNISFNHLHHHHWTIERSILGLPAGPVLGNSVTMPSAPSRAVGAHRGEYRAELY